MVRKKKEVELPTQPNAGAQAAIDVVNKQEQYGSSLVAMYADDLAILDALAKKVDIPDDKPAGISLRNQAVLHLLAGADLHRVGEDVVQHRIKRCIDIANLVVELLGEDNGEV